MARSRNAPYFAGGEVPIFRLSYGHLPVTKACSAGITKSVSTGDLLSAMDAIVGFLLPGRTVYTLKHIGVEHWIADPSAAFCTAVEVLLSFGLPCHLQFLLLRISPNRLGRAQRHS